MSISQNFSISSALKYSFQRSFHPKLLSYVFFFPFAFFLIFLFSYFFMFLIGSIPIFIVSLFLLYKIKRWALYLNGVELPSKDISIEILNYYIFKIRKSLLEILCWYNKELLIPMLFLLAIGLIFLGFQSFTLISFILIFLSIVWYFIIFIYHKIHLTFGTYLFLSGFEEEQNALEVSYNFIKEKKLTLKIFLATFVLYLLFLFLFLLLFSISYLLLLYNFFIGFFISLFFGALFYMLAFAVSENFFAYIFKEFYFNNYKNNNYKNKSSTLKK
ncbi:MAG: hypothetical protein ACK4J0_04085 [Candidatus Anstonellaceae archaeon]